MKCKSVTKKKLQTQRLRKHECKQQNQQKQYQLW